MPFTRKRLSANLTVFGIVAFVCLFALTHTATAWVIVGGWGTELPYIRGFIYVGNLRQDPLFTSSVHGVWLFNNADDENADDEDFSVDFTYEFKHQILDSTQGGTHSECRVDLHARGADNKISGGKLVV